MRREKLVAWGFYAAAAGFLDWQFFVLTLGAPTWQSFVPGLGALGLFLAGLGYAQLERRGPAPIALGLGLFAAANVIALVNNLIQVSPSTIPFAIRAPAALLMAWRALAWTQAHWSDEAASGLRVGAAMYAISAVLGVAFGFAPEAVPFYIGNAFMLVGFGLIVKASAKATTGAPATTPAEA